MSGLDNIFKTVILQEELTNYVNEEYHISLDVVKNSSLLIKEICKVINNRYNSDKKEKANGLWELRIDFQSKVFNNEINIQIIYYNFLDKNFYQSYINKLNRFNGFDYASKTLKITVLSISGNIILSDLTDTVQHELQHFYQQLKSKSIFNQKNNLYNYAIKNIRSDNIFLNKICRLIYLSRKFEVEGYINGLYAYLKYVLSSNRNVDVYEELTHNDVYFVLEEIKEIRRFLILNKQNKQLNNVIDMFSQFKINYNKLIKIADYAIETLKIKIGQTIFKVKQELNINECYTDGNILFPNNKKII